MRLLLLCLLCLFNLLATLPARAADEDTSKRDAFIAQMQAQPLQRRIYLFEHRILPQLVYGSEGMLFNDLMAGNSEPLRQYAQAVVSEEFAQALRVSPKPDMNGVLVSFAPPQQTPHCYFVFIAQDGERLYYYTYEKTMDLFQKGDQGVLGGWNPSYNHENFGTFSWSDSNSFLEQIASLRQKSAKAAITSTTKP